MKTHLREAVIFFVIFFISFSHLIAQKQISLHGQLQFRYITTNEGLSENNTASICQDHQGFIWIGTWYNGVNRYDGFDIKPYLFDPLDTNSLNGDRVFVILSDSKNNLWIGTDKGLNLYNREKDNFIRFR